MDKVLSKILFALLAMKTESRLWEQTATFQQSWRARTWKPGKWKYFDYKGAFHKQLFCSKIIALAGRVY